jgi:phage baseplate assembly protein W
MTTSITGFAFPFRIDPITGGVRSQSDDDKLRANIIHILLTNLGERVMRRDYGAGLRRLVQSPNDNALWTIMQHQASKAIAASEPRVLVQGVNVSQSDDGATLVVSVTYLVRRTQAVQALSVPITLGGL